MVQWRISLAVLTISVTATVPNLAAGKHAKKTLLIVNVSLCVAISSPNHLTLFIVNNTLLYLPWNNFLDNSTRDIGTIAFVLISSNDDVLSPDSLGLEEPVTQTLALTVSSWIANDTLGESRKIDRGSEELMHCPDDADKHPNSFPENVSVTIHYWPIACTMYLEDLIAHVRDNNTLLSHPFNNSQDTNLQPFVRALPSSPYERAWGFLFDAIWSSQIQARAHRSRFGGEYLPLQWLERQVFHFLNGTASTSSQKIRALEADLQSITSVAFSLLVQQMRARGNLTSLSADVLGQQQTPAAKLHVNGLQTAIGLFCVATLFFCALYEIQMRDGLMPQGDRYFLAGDTLDLMCLMRGSSLPELLVKPSSTPDVRRDRAESIGVA